LICQIIKRDFTRNIKIATKKNQGPKKYFEALKMEYRLLSKKELDPLKEDFIKFLAANTITGEDWVKIKSSQNKEANRILKLFSDLVWEKSIENIQFLEHRDHKHVKVFNCKEEGVSMVGFSVKSESSPSLMDSETFERLGSGRLKFSSLKPVFHHSKKNYILGRSQEVYQLIDSGCLPCEKSYYYGIKSLIK
jgi:hypothetical protein